MAVDYENDLILITCSSGKQASHLLPHLLPKWKKLRLQAHSDASVQRLRDQYPTAEVVKADMSHPDDAARLLAGVTAIWHVNPTFHRHETQIGYIMIDAAIAESQKAGSKFQHFVFSSVLQTQLRKLLNHDAKRYVEEYLMESGLNFTILQPSQFIDNFPLSKLAQQENPVFEAPYNLNGHAFSILKDYGEAAAKVFSEREKHYFAQYPLVSTYPTPYNDIIRAAGSALGREVKVERIPYEQAVSGLVTNICGHKHVDPKLRDAAERLILYYNRRGLVGNPTVLEWLLGRKPTTPEEWMKAGVEKVRDS